MKLQRIISAINARSIKRNIFIGSLTFVFFAVLHVFNLDPLYPAIYLLLAALLVAAFSFLLRKMLDKSRRDIFAISLLIFSVCSTLPYLWQMVIYRPAGIHIHNLLVTYALTMLFVLPEAAGILCIFLFKHRHKLIGLSVFVIALFLAVIILPIRMNFVFTSVDSWDILRFNDKDGTAFAKEDRELEFKRSIAILDNLNSLSADTSPADRATIHISRPDLTICPKILNNDFAWKGWFRSDSCFVYQKINLSVKSDFDEDGLSDFAEALLLSDPFDQDTDDDGYIDGTDSDPLNDFALSDIAQIRAAVLEVIAADSTIALMDNTFRDGRGEISNWPGHVVILSHGSRYIWETIFMYRRQELPVPCMFVEFGACYFDITRLLAIQYYYAHDSEPEHSGVVLLTALTGKWCVLGVHGFTRDYQRRLLD